MNILILSAGTKCQLVNYFKRKENGFDKVITTDCSKYAPAIYLSDKHYIVPKINADNYLPVIKYICKEENINVILPLLEDELELIALHRTEFNESGILVCISDIHTITLCRDKYLLYKHLQKNNIPAVTTYQYKTELHAIKELKLPVLVKEKTGAGSIGNLKVNDWPLLSAYAGSTEKELIVQPYYKAEEYGIDTYVDMISGEITAIFAKEKLKMQAGETAKSRSVIDKNLYHLVYAVTDTLNFRGPFDMDVFKYDGEYHVLEINPRFGGGYPHAYECGVNFMKFISANARGEINTPKIGEYQENQYLLKYTDAILKDEKDMF